MAKRHLNELQRDGIGPASANSTVLDVSHSDCSPGSDSEKPPQHFEPSARHHALLSGTVATRSAFEARSFGNAPFDNVLREFCHLVLLSAIASKEPWTTAIQQLESELQFVHFQLGLPTGDCISASVAKASTRHYSAEYMSYVLRTLSQIDHLSSKAFVNCADFPQWEHVHREAMKITSLSGAAYVTFRLFRRLEKGSHASPLASVTVLPIHDCAYDHVTPFYGFATLYFIGQCKGNDMRLEVHIGDGPDSVGCSVLHSLVQKKTGNKTQ
jgi:hypothetical protein